MLHAIDKALELWDRVNSTVQGSEIKLMAICIVAAIVSLKEYTIQSNHKNKTKKNETLGN